MDTVFIYPETTLSKIGYIAQMLLGNNPHARKMKL